MRFTNAELKQRNLITEWGYNQIKFIATVKEELTGIERNGTGEMTVHKYPTKVKITKPTDTFKPGLDYNIMVKFEFERIRVCIFC